VIKGGCIAMFICDSFSILSSSLARGSLSIQSNIPVAVSELIRPEAFAVDSQTAKDQKS